MRFEDLQCWQEARMLVKMVYQAISESSAFQKDFRLSSQMSGAAVSAMCNIAEGFSRRFNKEFVQFLFISKSSATEVQSEAYVALDQNYISPSTFESIYNQAEKVSKLDSGFIKYLLSNKPDKLDKLNKPKKENYVTDIE